MTERVLSILRRQGKNISCFFDGKLLEKLSNSEINQLLNQIKKVGSIRKATVIFDRQIKPEEYEFYINQGLSPTIVPSEEDVYLALNSMEVIISKQMDILCLGITDSKLLPVIALARETTEIMLITYKKEDIKSCLPYADYLIVGDELSKEQ